MADNLETSRRAARLETCPRCGADTLTGDDHDHTSMRARVDTTPVDHLTEVAALLAGRQSYDLVRGALHHRQPWHHHGSRPHPVLLEHRCEPTPKETLW